MDESVNIYNSQNKQYDQSRYVQRAESDFFPEQTDRGVEFPKWRNEYDQHNQDYRDYPELGRPEFAISQFELTLQVGVYADIESHAKVKDEYDYIFIDCPPSLGLLTINSLTAVDSVLIPIQCEYYALEGVSQLMSTIELVKKSLNPHLEIQGVVLSMFDGRTNLSIAVVEEVKKYFREKVYTTVIPRNVRLAEAPSFGMPIFQYDPHSRGAEAYDEFADEFLSLEEE